MEWKYGIFIDLSFLCFLLSGINLFILMKNVEHLREKGFKILMLNNIVLISAASVLSYLPPEGMKFAVSHFGFAFNILGSAAMYLYIYNTFRKRIPEKRFEFLAFLSLVTILIYLMVCWVNHSSITFFPVLQP